MEMLGTIRVPKNMSLLKSNLPQKNYDTDKELEPKPKVEPEVQVEN